MDRAQKNDMVAELRSDFSNALGAVLVNYQGISVKKSTEIRKAFREQGVSFRVVKNSLARIAIEGTPLEVIKNDFVGPIAIAYSHEFPVAVAKVAKKFADTEAKFQITCGCVENSRLDLAGVKQLAEMPSKEELQAKFLATLMAPATQLVRVLNEIPTQIVRVLAAKQETM